MPDYNIASLSTYDARFSLPSGAGSDAAHTNPQYCFATTLLKSQNNVCGTGIALTLGEGNRLVCDAIELLAKPLLGRPIEDLMTEFGSVSRQMADDPS
ncbi:MAG: mandelate racemase, partial [Silvibacterium sp.]